MMIEPLLEAERAFDMGLLDQAERLFRGVADADPRNSIAVVGLSRVALERGDDDGALTLARRAAEIDPANPMAARMVARLEEVLAARAAAAEGSAGPAARPASEIGPTSAAGSAPAALAASEIGPGSAAGSAPAAVAGPAAGAASAGHAPALGPSAAAGSASPAAEPTSGAHGRRNRSLLERLLRRP